MRKTLPNRRPNATVTAEWNGHPITITIGFHPKRGLPNEVFADSLKGGQMQETLRDACVWASLLLQMGGTAQDLTKSLGRLPDYTGQEHAASPIGVIAEVVESAWEAAANGTLDQWLASPMGAIMEIVAEVGA